MTIKQKLSAIVGEAFAAEGYDPAYGEVRVSDRPDLAQFQCNGALAAAKKEKKNPRALGEAAATRLRERADIFADVSLAGPGFINLKLAPAFLNDAVNQLAGDKRCGGWLKSDGDVIVLDYGGPNVAKPLHVGHLRSAIIGESLKRLLRFVGDEVVGDIHLGDWGLQMGQLISELELRQPDLPHFVDGAEGPFEPIDLALADLEAMYPAASAACKEDPARADLARKATKALQDGRPGYRALWRQFVDLSVLAMRENYLDLGVEFDLWKGEADADAFIPDAIADLEAADAVEQSDGARIVRVARDGDKKEMPPVILVNSEGAVGYHATDIATILDRRRSINPTRMLYVVDNRQALHFEQVFRASEIAGYATLDALEHLGFGTMQGKDGKPFKTREGGVLKLRDLIDQVTDRAKARLEENKMGEGFTGAELADVARKVGVAALKFADLSNQRTTDYVFDLDRFMSFEGKTGPYMHYASVRIRSVLTKASERGAGAPGEIDAKAPEEIDLALCLLAFSDAVRSAYDKRMPHILCEHAYSLAQTFAKFYAACRIVDEADESVRSSRLGLCNAAGAQLDCALDLLGMPAPKRM